MRCLCNACFCSDIARPQTEVGYSGMVSKIKGRPTPLYDLHLSLGGRLVEFAGYMLPVQYRAGILAEHRQTRQRASLFDVSHMGQAELNGTADELEKIFPADLIGMTRGQMRYTFLLNEAGGIIDDLMICRRGDAKWQIVVNGACKSKDFDYLSTRTDVWPRDDLALLALQGPEASRIVSLFAPKLAALTFMQAMAASIAGVDCYVSRSGYTGEDGYEISLSADQARFLAAKFLEDEALAPAGLGARDTLRLEAGLCLYGQDIDETTSPIEAGLAWAIAPRRRKEGGFCGAQVILRQLSEGVVRCRAGFRIKGKRPVRPAAIISDMQGKEIGVVTSGGVAADCPEPITMGYALKEAATPDAQVMMSQRGQSFEAQVARLPFRPHRYFRGQKGGQHG